MTKLEINVLKITANLKVKQKKMLFKLSEDVIMHDKIAVLHNYFTNIFSCKTEK